MLFVNGPITAVLITQASALNPASDNCKYDRNVMDRKLLDIRNELKVDIQNIYLSTQL